MVSHSDWQDTFNGLGKKTVVVEPVDSQLSSDAGVLPIRQFDETLGFTQRFAEALDDPRDQRFTQHHMAEMTRSRIYGILADQEDQNDHDALRSDPVFKIIAGRSAEAKDLASQPTLSRFENSISVASLFRLRDVLIDQFIKSFKEPPARLTFDIDTYDDPAHGQQQLVMFHGYYNQYQYQPRVVTCAENDLVVMFDRCESLGIGDSFGLKMNNVLKRNSDETLEHAVALQESGEGPQRLFTSFEYQAGSWPAARQTIVKCEANAQGTNRPAIVTNRAGARVLPEAAYDEYSDRGESENRNKELKCGLAGDRLSDHRYMANLFRLQLHAAALSLLVLLRHELAAPPQQSPAAAIPPEAFSDPVRKRFENERRRNDPLGEGHPCTWRSRLIKVAAEVVETTRRIHVKLSGCWPFLDFSDAGCQTVTGDCVPAGPD